MDVQKVRDALGNVNSNAANGASLITLFKFVLDEEENIALSEDPRQLSLFTPDSSSALDYINEVDAENDKLRKQNSDFAGKITELERKLNELTLDKVEENESI